MRAKFLFVVALFLSDAPFSAVVTDATGVELFFVARTASGSAQVRASARHCHRPLRSSTVASLDRILPLSSVQKFKNFFPFFSERFGRLVTVIQGPGGAPGTRAR